MDRAGLEDVDASKRICKCLDTKIRCLLEKGKKAQGGVQARVLEQKLRSGKPYELKVLVSETNKMKLLNKNQELMLVKRKYEEDLLMIETKNRKLEEDLSKANASSHYWNHHFKTVVKRCMQAQRQKKLRGKRSFGDYSEHSKYRIKQELKTECQSALSFIGLHDLIATKVEYFDPLSQSHDCLCLIDDDEMTACITEPPSSTMDAKKLDDVLFLLYLKEKFNISNRAWQELSFICKDLPSTYSLKKRIEALNSHWNIKATPGVSEGVQLSLKESLCEQVERLIKEGKLDDGQVLKVKVSGDGTRALN